MLIWNMESSSQETQRVRAFYDKVASNYDRFMGLSEKVFFGNGRSWVCRQASGQVLEIAIGTGRNFPYYPPNKEFITKLLPTHPEY
jgi:ubiquinone/menaquinone biosynthesis C-methylase UbiE